MRKLASIQKVLEINPIKDADKIESAKVLGWQCVVKKSENFKVNDLAVYFEIDSLLDENNPSYEFLKKDGKISRLRTVKLKKTLSQGLLLPISILNHYGCVFVSDGKYNLSIIKENGVEEIVELVEGVDLTSITKTEKYEAPISAELHGLIKGQFPSRIPKTDEPRCLHESVIVTTEFGNMTIEDICKNNFYGKVLSYNDELGTLEYKNITGHEVTKNNNDWYEIDIGDNITIIATGNHMIYLPECDIYRRVDELNGDESVSFLIKN